MYLSFFNLAYCLYLCSAAATLTALLFQDGRRNSFYFSSVSVMLLLFVFVCMHRVYIYVCTLYTFVIAKQSQHMQKLRE